MRMQHKQQRWNLRMNTATGTGVARRESHSPPHGQKMRTTSHYDVETCPNSAQHPCNQHFNKAVEVDSWAEKCAHRVLVGNAHKCAMDASLVPVLDHIPGFRGW
eukprot:566574-Rhodomonas_salina.1